MCQAVSWLRALDRQPVETAGSQGSCLEIVKYVTPLVKWWGSVVFVLFVEILKNEAN